MFAEKWMSLIGIAYIGTVILALLLALRLPKKGWAKGLAITSVLGLTFGVPYLVSRPSASQTKDESEFSARATQAKARFEQLCKERAELAIHRRVTDVSGIRLMKVIKGKDVYHSYWERDWPDAAMAGEFFDELFIASFLAHGMKNEDGTFTGNYNSIYSGELPGYSYVDVWQDGGWYKRYRLDLSARKLVSDDILFSEDDPKLSRYAVYFNNEIDMDSRLYWIAGTEIIVKDMRDGSLLGVLRRYSMDPGLGYSGSNSSRTPWLHAVSNSCPDMKTSFMSGQVRFFVSKILEERGRE